MMHHEVSFVFEAEIKKQNVIDFKWLPYTFIKKKESVTGSKEAKRNISHGIIHYFMLPFRTSKEIKEKLKQTTILVRDLFIQKMANTICSLTDRVFFFVLNRLQIIWTYRQFRGDANFFRCSFIQDTVWNMDWISLRAKFWSKYGCLLIFVCSNYDIQKIRIDKKKISFLSAHKTK